MNQKDLERLVLIAIAIWLLAILLEALGRGRLW